MTDKAFLAAIAALELFLGWRQWTTPSVQRTIEFVPLEFFALGFIVAGVAVLVFILRPSSFWLVASGGLTVAALTGRAVAGLYAGYHDSIIPISRAQTGFAAWMLGAVLVTWVWTLITPPRQRG